MADVLTEIIATSNMEKMIQLFPNAQSLIDYNHAHPDHPILEQLVEGQNPAFLKEVFQVYFSDDNIQTQALKHEFLEAENISGQKMNYHYFAPYLPSDYTAKVSEAFCVSAVETVEKHIPEDVAMELYQIIKDERTKITERRNELYEQQQKSLLYDPQEEYSYLPPLYVRHVSRLNIDKKEDNLVFLPRIKLEGDILTQAYETMDFPDDFTWSAQSLRNIQRDFMYIINDEEAKLQLSEFYRAHACLVLEDNKSQTGCNTDNYCAFASREGVTFNDPDYKKSCDPSITYHELVHFSDLHVDNHIFSNTVVCQAAVMMMDASGDETLSGQRCQHIHRKYKSGNMFVEGLAYVTETQLSIFSNHHDHLAKNLFILNNLYCEARANHNQEVLDAIEEWRPKPELQQLLGRYIQKGQYFPDQNQSVSSVDREETLLLWKELTFDLIKLRKKVNHIKLQQDGKGHEQNIEQDADLLYAPAAVAALKAYDVNQQYENPSERHILFLKYLDQQLYTATYDTTGSNKLAFAARYLKHFMRLHEIDCEFMNDMTINSFGDNLKQFHRGMQSVIAFDDYNKHSETEHIDVLKETLENLSEIIEKKEFNKDFYYQKAYLKQYLKEKNIDDSSMYNMTDWDNVLQMKVLATMAVYNCDQNTATLATHFNLSVDQVKRINHDMENLFAKDRPQEEYYKLLKQISEKTVNSPKNEMALLIGARLLSKQNNVPFSYDENCLVRDMPQLVQSAQSFVHDCQYLYGEEKENQLSSEGLTLLRRLGQTSEKLDELMHMDYETANKICADHYQKLADAEHSVFGNFFSSYGDIEVFMAMRTVYQRKTGKQDLPQEMSLSSLSDSNFGIFHSDFVVQLCQKYKDELNYPVIHRENPFGNPFALGAGNNFWGEGQKIAASLGPTDRTATSATTGHMAEKTITPVQQESKSSEDSQSKAPSLNVLHNNVVDR